MKVFSRYFIILMFGMIVIIAYGCGGHEEHEHAGETHGAEAAVHDGHDHDVHEDEALGDHGHTAGEDQDPEHEQHADDDGHGHDDADHEGHSHEAGETVETGSDWEEMISLETVIASVKPMELTLTVPGAIIPDQNRKAVVSPFIAASVRKVFVNVGDRVAKNAELACLASPEIGMMRAEYTKAKAELAITQQVFARQERLFEEDIIPRRTFEEAELALHVAQVDFEYTRKRLLAIGLNDDELESDDTCSDDVEGASIHVHAPIGGIITRRSAHLGEMVDAESQLFEIMDLGTVWLEADIFEKDLADIHIGQKVLVRVSAFENVFRGEIFHIGSTLDEITKTIKILVEIDNKAEYLKPGMYASTDIVIGEKTDALVIPENAVLRDENLSVVFVREGNDYHRHVVTTGMAAGGSIEITGGLEPGDVVVTTGNFQLKSRLRMNGIDPHAGHNH